MRVTGIDLLVCRTEITIPVGFKGKYWIIAVNKDIVPIIVEYIAVNQRTIHYTTSIVYNFEFTPPQY